MAQIGENDYREGARARLAEAARLYQGDCLSGRVYLAGRAVESVLRGLIWKPGRSMETGHDLRKLFTQVVNMGLMSGRGCRRYDPSEGLRSLVDMIAARWLNNMRFVSDRWVEACWRSKCVVTKKNTYRHATKEFCDVCSSVISQCEKLYGKVDQK